MIIQVVDIVPACDTNEEGDAVLGVILPALRSGEDVCVSFKGVHAVTSSFVNSAFVALLDQVTFDYIKAHLDFKNSTRQINEMIRSRLTKEAGRLSHAA